MNTIGIWGFGRVGKAAATFFEKQGYNVLIWDDKPIACPYPVAPSLTAFFACTDKILASPGVDIEHYYTQSPTLFLSELDLFQQNFKKKIIAVTGSVGKTTVVTMLTQSLTLLGWRVVAAGNIGTPCFDVIENQDNLDAVILEVSSFQLEHCKQFAPHLAIWTNLYPNHLDRHKTMDRYFDSKCNIIAHQTAMQHAIIPHALKREFDKRSIPSQIRYCTETGITQNKTIVAMALEILTGTKEPPVVPVQLEHRFELVAVSNNITFINDSKSTTPESTRAALEQLDGKKIFLFLGGLSKGIDRSDFILGLPQSITVFCFGKEAATLNALCKKNNITSSEYQTLADAFGECITLMQPGDFVLLSPAGSSYDLYQNYEERGRDFKKMVIDYCKKQSR